MQYFSASFQFDQIEVQSGVSEQNFAVIQIPDSVFEGDDASQGDQDQLHWRGLSLYIITSMESPNIKHD